MAKNLEQGPQGKQVCSWCPLKGTNGYYVGLHPICGEKGIMHCNNLLGSERGLTPLQYDPQNNVWEEIPD